MKYKVLVIDKELEKVIFDEEAHGVYVSVAQGEKGEDVTGLMDCDGEFPFATLICSMDGYVSNKLKENPELEFAVNELKRMREEEGCVPK